MGRRAVQLSAVLNGVMLASQVRDQARLVPMWERLEPDEFRAWFRLHAVRSASWHAPLLFGGLGAAAVGARRATRVAGHRTLLCLALIGVALHTIVTLLVHVPANAVLLSTWGSESSDRLRRRWIRWHVIRTGALAVGEAAAVAALALRG